MNPVAALQGDNGMHNGDQSEVVEFLKQSAGDPSCNDDLCVIRTHISIVVLRGARAWKLKRALRLPYADFSTPALRAAACEDEVTLNRRTAPEIYLGVRRITREVDGGLAFDGKGEMIDAVVEMRRFDEQTLFSRLAATGGLNRELLTGLARTIAGFHSAADILHTGKGARRIADVLALNEQCTDMDPILGATAVRSLRAALRAGLEQHRHRLDTRAAAGKVRRCHGDLHLRNLCLVDGRPTLFDCIEFNETLATIDVLYDLAYLLMDLWQAGLRAEANWVMNRYMDACDEADGLALLPFFMALRASIRSQVLCTQACMLKPDGEDAREAIRRQAQAYLELAMQLLPPVPTRLVAIGGLSGSGKSTVAAAVAHRIGAAPGARILATDRIRKRLAGVSAETGLPPDTYTVESSERVYGVLCDEATQVLQSGYSVVADAVFSSPSERQRMAACAQRAAAAFDGIWLEATPDALLSRVEARRNDPSDATREVVLAQLERHVPPRQWARVQAGGPPEATVAGVTAVLAASARVQNQPAGTESAPRSMPPPWSDAPTGWNWSAQDEDGRWFWYAVEPQPGVAGGVWRAPRRAQVFAAQGEPNPRWYDSCRRRPKSPGRKVIDFWLEAGPERWFNGGEAFDAECRERFLELHLAAARGELAHWCDDAEGSLALLLLLDQMPRNVFRGSAHAYATDPMARSVAGNAIARGHDREYGVELRGFFYLPFMHSESLADQQRCVELFHEIPESGSSRWATHHLKIVERFGRFPHRNRLLGRETTPEEQAWLDEGGFTG